jgi:hypothetical protein
VRHGQRATGQEIVLDILDDESIAGMEWQRLGHGGGVRTGGSVIWRIGQWSLADSTMREVTPAPLHALCTRCHFARMN